MFIPPEAAGLLRKYGVFIAIAAATALILTLAYCQGKDAGKQKEVTKQLERTIEVQESQAAANEVAAEARLRDRLTIEQQKKELEDAINSGEDRDTLRLRTGCLLMRQQHRPTLDYPACRRFEGVGRARIPD